MKSHIAIFLLLSVVWAISELDIVVNKTLVSLVNETTITNPLDDDILSPHLNMRDVLVQKKCANMDRPFPKLVQLDNEKAPDFIGDLVTEQTCSDTAMVRRAIKHALDTKRGFLFGKIGGTEYTQMNYVFKTSHKDKIQITDKILLNSGVFPLTVPVIQQWKDTYVAAIKQMDVVVIWSGNQKHDLYNKTNTMLYKTIHSKNSSTVAITSLYSLWPWYWKKPYSKYFENKTVLVVSPFGDDITRQFNNNRTCLFPYNADILPPFTLKSIRSALPPVNSTNQVRMNFGDKSFFTVMRDLIEQIDNTNYDVLIIGAGAYGLPIGAHAKSKGKVAIVMGGNVGPQFGIKGGRFDKRPDYKQFLYNDCWLRIPAPPAAKFMEKSAYWRP